MNNKKIIGLLVIFVCLVGLTRAEDSYVESLNRVRDQVIQSETNLKAEINSFNGAFQDAFKLIDDEISRLIFANAAMVGLCFAINFLVYAKTSTKSRRDLQVLLVAHSKHIDNMVSAKLDDFTRNIGSMIEEKKKEDMSTLESLDDQIKGVVSDGVVAYERKSRKPESSLSIVSTVPEVHPQRKMPRIDDIIKEDEVMKDSDNRVLIPKKSSGPGIQFFKRVKLGVLRVLGRKKHKENIDEFKLK